MEIYRVGEKIKEERARRSFSQEDVCTGICSTGTLSRIENGTQKPNLKMQEALLERLGCSTENLVFFASNEEAEKHNLELELGVLTMHRKPIGEKLREYAGLISDASVTQGLEKQFLLTMEAICGFYSREWELSRVFEQLEGALRLSVPNYEECKVTSIKLLTNTEITILNNLALVLYRQEEHVRAISIMNYLVRYVENSDFNVETTGKKYPMLIYNLARMMDTIGSYKEMHRTCDKGIEFCKKYGRLAAMPELFYSKAVACQKLDKIPEAIECLEYAICLDKIMDKRDIVDELQAEYNELLKYNCKINHEHHNTLPQEQIQSAEA